MLTQISIDPTLQKQSFIVSLEPNGEAFMFRLEVEYREETDHWYMSVYDSETGISYCQNIPLIACIEDADLNNLFAPFHYKKIGSLFVYPLVQNPSTPDPAKDSLGEFGVFWGDNYGE